MRRFPFPTFPMSWFQLAWSDEVPQGGRLHVKAFGTDWVIRRDGGLQVTSLRDRLQNSLIICEKNNMIFVYYHPNHSAPPFEVPDLVEVSSRAF